MSNQKRSRRTRYAGPAAGPAVAAALDAALAEFGRRSGLDGPLEDWRADGGVELQLLTSLRAEIDSRTPRDVVAARDAGYSWAEIGDMLGVGRSAAWQRFGRVPPPPPPAPGGDHT